MLAEKIFVVLMSHAEGMGCIDKEERMKLFKIVAEYSFEMEEAFNEVYEGRDNSDEYL